MHVRTGRIVETVTMYRPIGEAELELLRTSNFLRWPPRLPQQPIFYPVTNARYATEIAQRWNARDGAQGFVTRFTVRKDFADRYAIQQVGDAYHTEWWIPAEDLELLNDAIVGKIDVVTTFS